MVEDSAVYFRKHTEWLTVPIYQDRVGVLRHGVFTTKPKRLSRARSGYLVTLTVTLPPEGYARELGKVKKDCL